MISHTPEANAFHMQCIYNCYLTKELNFLQLFKVQKIWHYVLMTKHRAGVWMMREEAWPVEEIPSTTRELLGRLDPILTW